MKTKAVGSINGSIPKATNCTPKATTSIFGKSGASLKAKSKASPSKLD